MTRTQRSRALLVRTHFIDCDSTPSPRPLPHGGEGKADPQRSVFTVESKSNPKHGPLSIGTVAMVKDHYKLIYYFGHEDFSDEYELFDLESDPEELNNLYNTQPSLALELQNELKTKLDEVNQPYSSG